MKKLILSAVFTSIACLGFNQLNSSANYAKACRIENDTIKVNGLNALAKHHINANQDSSEFYAEKALLLSQKLNYRQGIIGAHLSQGVLETDKGNYTEALDLLLNASGEAEKIKDARLLGASKLLLGNVYILTKDYDKAVQSYRDGIEITKQNNLYTTQSSLYIALGMGLRYKGEIDSALYYYNEVLEIEETHLHDSVAIAAIYNNIASVHYTRGDLAQAEEYLLKSYEINKLMRNERYQMMNLGNLGGLAAGFEGKGGDLNKAIKYYDMAIEMAEKMQAKDALQSFHEALSSIYYNYNKFQDAFMELKLSIVYQDSILNEKKQKQILAISEEFKTKQIQDSLRINQQELKLSQTNEEAATLKAAKTTWQLVGSVVLLLFILVVLFQVYRSSKNQKKINLLLSEKNNEINHQKMTIEEKNSELTDSINYAKRIQNALLPSATLLAEILGDHFLLFKPKDIVSGDFYWAKKDAKHHYFAVADCTGHGVPGAMVSMLGYETIEKISSQEITNAADFVSKINNALVNSLSTKTSNSNDLENQVRDGMDLSLCIVTDRRKLNFCGANNSGYVIRKNDIEMPKTTDDITIFKGERYSVIELKATKRPIGFYHAEHEFKNVELDLKKDDVFYLFSDGYPDQFGGEKGKKMKTSTFREILLSTAGKPLSDQLADLKNHLEKWQNNFDQLDDITVLGVRVE